MSVIAHLVVNCIKLIINNWSQVLYSHLDTCLTQLTGGHFILGWLWMFGLLQPTVQGY